MKKKLNKRVQPPWSDDMEEALVAQREAPRRQTALLPSGRWSSRSRLVILFKLGVILALLLVCFLYALLSCRF
jgi:hypothetical protein